jgi:hypothetical protein
MQEHFRAVFTFERVGVTATCTLYYLHGSGGQPEAADMNQVADFIQTTHAQKFAEIMAYPVRVLPCNVYWRDGLNSFDGISTDGPVDGGVGTQALPLDALPEQDALIIQRRTNLAGRSKRGRIFVPFVPESFFADSTITATALPIVKTLATSLVKVLTNTPFGYDLTPCQPSWKTGTMHQVTGCRIVSEVGSRKDRRNPKRPVAHAAPSPA